MLVPPATTAPPGRTALPWWRRWRTALLGAFLLLVLVGAGQGMVGVVAEYRRVEAAAVAQHAAEVEVLATATEQLVARYLVLLGATAESAFDPALTDDRRHVLLAGIKATQPTLDYLVLVEPGGRILDAVPPDSIGTNVAGAELHRAILAGAGTTVGDFGPGRVSGLPAVRIAAAARAEDGTLRGLVVARLPIDELSAMLDVRLSGDARAILVDRTGRIVAHTGLPSLAWLERDLSANPAIAEALAGRVAIWDRIPSPWSSGPLVGAVRPVGSFGWALAVVQPLETALAPARSRLREALTDVGLSLAVGLALALVLSGRLARPIAALSEGVAALGRGDLGHRVPARGGGELASLAEHFNAMTDRLSEASDAARALNARLMRANRELGDREAEAEGASRRDAFLAEVGARLAGTLDYEATLASTARLAVPHFADYCIVDLLEPDGAIRRVAVAHADPARAALARDLERYPPSPRGAHPMLEVLRTGTPVLLVEPDAWMAGESLDPAYVEVVGQLGARSNMIAPLVARGRVVGALTFALADSGRQYRLADLEFAGEVARRAALAVDNARLYQEAQDAVRARDAFLARASHELRTPLTSIVGTVRLARRALAGRLGESPGLLLEVADRNLTTMVALINNLLDASKLTAGAEVLEASAVDLGDVARRSAEVVAAQARERRVHLEVKVPDGLRLAGDPLKLEQVLINLLANGVSFTPAGGRVTLEAEPERGAVVIRVRDTGEGIPPEDLDRVFEPFVQVRERHARRHGTGLGLTICRQIVSLHGGRIWAESEGEGRGSTFVVSLPEAVRDRSHAA